MEFTEFPKIARLSREVIVTEKIDETNGCIYIGDDGDMYVGSRTRWITPDKDNHGFARWAFDHAIELHEGLGPGRHFGEWWGSGIQRGYGLPKGEKRFSLFNTIRWCQHDEEPQRIETGDLKIEKYQTRLPKCCHLVPILWKGTFDTETVDRLLRKLDAQGSQASPGFMKPEGIVVYHVAGNVAFKKTLGNDGHKRR
ncbi:MAG: RNA ligase family protein [Patescibacteria group bacterium]